MNKDYYVGTANRDGCVPVIEIHPSELHLVISSRYLDHVVGWYKAEDYDGDVEAAYAAARANADFRNAMAATAADPDLQVLP